MLVQVEILTQPIKEAITYNFSRVPCLRERVVLPDETVYTVQSVCHIADADEDNELSAYIRIN